MKKLLFKILSEADGAALGKQVGLEKSRRNVPSARLIVDELAACYAFMTCEIYAKHA